MTGGSWKELLALEGRTAPELFERGKPVQGSPYADEIRKAIEGLSISGVFCIQGVPQIAILEQDEYDRESILRVHAALWNQGLASVLVVSAGDEVRVFSLAKAPGSGDHRQFEDRCLIEALSAGAAALSLKSYVFGAESGRLWREKSDFFNPKERIDAVLLRNLTVAHELLTLEGLSPAEAQAILIQTMFIAYLEDRQITTAEFFRSITEERYDTFGELLDSDDDALIEGLFEQLQQDFNGDLFVAPCSFDDPDHPYTLNKQAMQVLRRFRDGREEMSATSGQLRFWGYDFKFIPVELISAVYDRFLGHDESARRSAGAYYTPMFLVDTVVSSVWESIDDGVKERGVFLDPACGSGIFLVRCFQRLCEHWRKNAKPDRIRWDSLVKMLGRVQGSDLNGGAVRVAVFSLYIALLEEVTPPDIRKLARRGRLLPPLWNRTLTQRDFFEVDSNELRADVVVGNPPWTSRQGTRSSGIEWCRDRGLPTPSGEDAWAFTWKALDHLETNGVVAFLLPSMGFLHNHAANSVAARVQLFESTRMVRVVNFSDLRRQLFESAINASSLLLFKKESETPVDYKFDYWTPKADLNISIKRFVALSSVDKSLLRLSDVKRDALIFKQRLWMREPEAKLFSFLDRLPKLGDFIGQYGPLKRRKADTSTGWVIGQGFKPFHGGRPGSSSAQSYQSEIVSSEKYLPIEALSPIAIDTSALEPWPSKLVHRKGFERGFSGSRVLFPRGVATASMRLRAAYVEEPLTFQHILQAIAAPDTDKERAKFITAVLNSRLAVWFAFHGTASFGSSRPEVQQAELLKLPMPEPEDLADPRAARKARKKLIRLVEGERDRTSELLRAPDVLERTLREIDVQTYEYFGLSEDETALIEDAVEHLLPAAQPNAGTYPTLWKPTTSDDRSAYAHQLSASLLEWFEGVSGISIELTGSNQDFGILRLQLDADSGQEQYRERADRTFTASLGDISAALNRPIATNFQLIPDMRIFLDDCLYLIKPMQLRFWLRSAALADADSIASDLQTLIDAQAREDLAS